MRMRDLRSRQPTARLRVATRPPLRCSEPDGCEAAERHRSYTPGRGIGHSDPECVRFVDPAYRHPFSLADASPAATRAVRPERAKKSATNGCKCLQSIGPHGYPPSASITALAVSWPEKFCWPVIRLPSRIAKPRQVPA